MIAFTTLLVAGVLVALFACVTLTLVAGTVKAGLGWSVAWTVTFGIAVLAPHLLQTHRLVPRGLLDWLTVSGALVAIFAVIGAALFVVPTAILSACWLVVRHRRHASADVLFAVGTGALIPAAYAAAAAVIELAAFGRVAGLAPYAGVLPKAAAAYALWCVALGLVCYASCTGRLLVRPRVMRAALAAGLALGLLSLPWRLEVESSAAESVYASVTLDRARPQHAPLLVIGIDGGNWRLLQPAIARGDAPTLARLASTGVVGDVHALWSPYWSSPAWGAIVTGYSREEIGIYEDMSVTAAGLPRFSEPLTADLAATPVGIVELAMARIGLIEPVATPREALKRPPFWELASQGGLMTGVLRFPFTYPADREAGIVVSDRTGHDAWSLLPVRPPSSGLVSSAASRLGLDTLYSGPLPDEDGLFHALMPELDRPIPPDSNVNPSTMLRIAASIDEHTTRAALRVLGDQPDIDLFAVYLGGFDGMCHEFWQYRFPEDYPDEPPAPEDVRVLGPVLDRYVAYLDRRLATIIAAFPEAPNVIVVSDHGHEAAAVSSLWRGWHGPDGIFIAAGPDVPKSEARLDVTYYDIAPTIFDLLGFEKPKGMRGRSTLVAGRESR